MTLTFVLAPTRSPSTYLTHGNIQPISPGTPGDSYREPDSLVSSILEEGQWSTKESSNDTVTASRLYIERMWTGSETIQPLSWVTSSCQGWPIEFANGNHESYFYNQDFSSGLKRDSNVALWKKPSLDAKELANYRLVSNLPFKDKVSMFVVGS